MAYCNYLYHGSRNVSQFNLISEETRLRTHTKFCNVCVNATIFLANRTGETISGPIYHDQIFKCKSCEKYECCPNCYFCGFCKMRNFDYVPYRHTINVRDDTHCIPISSCHFYDCNNLYNNIITPQLNTACVHLFDTSRGVPHIEFKNVRNDIYREHTKIFTLIEFLNSISDLNALDQFGKLCTIEQMVDQFVPNSESVKKVIMNSDLKRYLSEFSCLKKRNLKKKELCLKEIKMCCLKVKELEKTIKSEQFNSLSHAYFDSIYYVKATILLNESLQFIDLDNVSNVSSVSSVSVNSVQQFDWFLNNPQTDDSDIVYLTEITQFDLYMKQPLIHTKISSFVLDIVL